MTMSKKDLLKISVNKDGKSQQNSMETQLKYWRLWTQQHKIY